MSSGEKQLVFNTRERAISTDHNRTEAFIARDRSQLARFQYNDQRQNTFQYPGVSTQYVGGEVPLAGDVFGGLMVDPQTTSLLITPGELGCLFPDPSITADDSPYMLIDDPGLQTAGILTFTANPGGGVRLDLVECHPVSTILESDNRDIFDPSSGLFAPVGVTKVQAFRLQYRLRLGTPGAGLPALAAGWLPLAVAVVTAVAADFSTVDFYDVRPLVEDRVEAQPSYNSSGGLVQEQYCPLRAEYWSRPVSGAFTIQGFAESQFGGYRAGGWVRRSSPALSGTFGGTAVGDGDPAFINCSSAENQVAGFSAVSNALVYLCAFFPGHLPRWVRYSESVVGGGLGRVPRGPRGILMIQSATTPLKNGVVTPMAIGAGFTTNAPGVVLGAFKVNSFDTAFTPVGAQNNNHRIAEPVAFAVNRTTTALTTWALVAGTHYPPSASELDVTFLLSFTNGGSDQTVEIDFALQDSSGNPVSQIGSVSLWSPAGSTVVCFTLRVPLVSRTGPVDAGGSGSIVVANVAGAPSTVFSSTSLQTMRIFGWELGN